MQKEGTMAERRLYRRFKIRLPLSFAILMESDQSFGSQNAISQGERIGAQTYDVSMEGLTVDANLSSKAIHLLVPLLAQDQKGQAVDVSVTVKGSSSVSLVGTVIWYNLFFPGTPPHNLKVGLYLTTPESSSSKQEWNDFIEAIRV